MTRTHFKKKVSPREELLELQRLLFERIHADIQDYTGRPSSALKKYRAEYERDLEDYQRLSSKSELIREVLKSDVVYCGDYHTLRQSQRSVIKILRDVVSKGRPIILGVELVHREDQEYLNRYLAGMLTEKEFLAKIHYRETWNFEWANYQQIFDFARKFKLQVIALNCHTGKKSVALTQRDLVAGEVIAHTLQANPGSLMFVLYGDLHVATAHIPAMVEKLLQRLQYDQKTRQLIIHQNSERLYWLLAERGLEQRVDVLKIGESRFCIMATPPWIKLQTYLNWLEHRDSDYQEVREQLGDFEDSYDYYHRLWDTTDTMATFLRLEKTHLDEFNVYSSGDVEFLDYLNNYTKRAKARDRITGELLQAEIIYNGTCLIPSEGMIFLATSSINKSAEKIAQFIHYKASHSELRCMQNQIHSPLYFGLILLEAIGYIGSKIINYKRKCELVSDHKKIIQMFRGKRLTRRLQEVREISKNVLAHVEAEQRYLKASKRPDRYQFKIPTAPRILYAVTQAIGQLLGERLYEAVIDNRLGKEEIRRLFLLPITCKTDNQSRYFEFCEKVKDIKPRYTSKSQRF